jgi:NhaC family Na+:H+ antiporter
MIYKKIPAFLTLFISAIISAVIAVFVQPQIIAQITPYAVDSLHTLIYAPLKILSMPVEIATDSPMLTELASTSGMAGMLNTVWLIMCVCAFGGVMESGGYLNTITEKMVGIIKSRTSLVGSTLATCIISNLTLSDQYMSIILPGKMFADIYRKEGYEPQLLSRSLEDSATVTSVLVPWNSCAAMQSSVLGIPTLAYLPYCFFNLLSPFVSLAIAAIGYKITRFGKPVRGKNLK